MIKLTKDMVVIDLETNSNRADSARIVSISTIRITPEGKMDKLYLVLNPEAPIDPKASEPHGFYEDDVKDCPTFKQKAVAIHNHISEYRAVYDSVVKSRDELRQENERLEDTIAKALSIYRMGGENWEIAMAMVLMGKGPETEESE